MCSISLCGRRGGPVSRHHAHPFRRRRLRLDSLTSGLLLRDYQVFVGTDFAENNEAVNALVVCLEELFYRT